VAKAAVWLGL